MNFQEIRADRLSNPSNLATPRREVSRGAVEIRKWSASGRVDWINLLSLKKSWVCGTFIELWQRNSVNPGTELIWRQKKPRELCCG